MTYKEKKGKPFKSRWPSRSAHYQFSNDNGNSWEHTTRKVIRTRAGIHALNKVLEGETVSVKQLGSEIQFRKAP